jgi:hypothetical protein
MKNNILIKPISYSVLILVLFSLLLYLTAGGPETTVWSSLGMIVTGIFRMIQWIIAMTLALLVCLAFLFAIFFGAVAIFDRKTSAGMYRNLKTLLFSRLLPLAGECCCCTSAQSSGEKVQAEDYLDDLDDLAALQEREAMNAEINSIQEHLHTTRQVLTDKIDQITSRIDSLEAMSADMADKKQLDDITHEVQDAVQSLAGIQSAVSAMQSCVDQTASQIREISPDKILGDLPQRVQTLEEQQGAAEPPEPVDITPLQNDINAMQSELSLVKEKADKALQAATDCCTTNADARAVQETVQETVQEEAQESAPEPASAPQSEPAPAAAAPQQEQEEHRIFSYFEEPADRKKLAELMTSTLDKDMSYKQVLNFLVKEFGPVKGKIISSHPSLAKDYIRQCRKNR